MIVGRRSARATRTCWAEESFAWKRWTLKKFINASAWFTANCEISQLQMMQMAACNLAATGTPAVAQQEALERAKAGELITPQVAAEISDWARSVDRCDSGTLPAYRLKSRLARILECYQQRWEE